MNLRHPALSLLLAAGPLVLMGRIGDPAQAQSPFSPPAHATLDRAAITATRISHRPDGTLALSGTVTITPLAPGLDLRAVATAYGLELRDGAQRLLATMPFDAATESVQDTGGGTILTDKAGDSLTIRRYAPPAYRPIYSVPDPFYRPRLSPPLPYGSPKSRPGLPYQPGNPYGAQIILCRVHSTRG